MRTTAVFAVLAYAEPRPTRDAGGLKHAAPRTDATTTICGLPIVAHGEPVPPQQPPGMCDTCATTVYGPGHM